MFAELFFDKTSSWGDAVNTAQPLPPAPQPVPAHHPAPRRTRHPLSPSGPGRRIIPRAPGAPQYRHSRAQVWIPQTQVEHVYGG